MALNPRPSQARGAAQEARNRKLFERIELRAQTYGPLSRNSRRGLYRCKINVTKNDLPGEQAGLGWWKEYPET